MGNTHKKAVLSDFYKISTKLCKTSISNDDRAALSRPCRFLGLVQYQKQNIIFANMVKVKFGSLVTNMSGKVGGQVYSHNASGAYMRNIGTIAVAPSPSIIASQVRFASVVAAWKALTDTQRNAWQSAVSNFLKKNVFADVYTPNGFQLFMSINNIRLTCGQAILNFPPVPEQPNPIQSLLITQNANALQLDIDSAIANVPANDTWLIDCTPPISPTKNNYKSLLTQIAVLAGGSALPSSIYAAYVAKYGLPVSGQRLGTRVTPVHTDSATQGQRFFYNILFL